MLKKIIAKILAHYVKRYFKSHNVKLVIAVGSVGKTSAKIAIATVLGEKFRVRTHDGNHNGELSAPLAILGVKYPDDIRSISAWREVFAAAKLRIKEPQDVDVIVQELATDHPGDIPAFCKYLRPDITVVTSVGLEHMENFADLDAVAREELSIASYSAYTLINRDDVDARFAKYAQTESIGTYGLSSQAEFNLQEVTSLGLDGGSGSFISPTWEPIPVVLQLVGAHSLKSAVAAGAVGARLGLTASEVATGMAKIRPVNGRMNVLRGVKGSMIIDDSYNATPMAVSAALKTLYSLESPQRIAILGSMGELGDISPKAHAAVGEICKPEKLDWVVTVGDMAAKYLAPVAHKNGCQVKSFRSSILAGGFVNSVIRPGALILVKGSQNNIFTEEAVKVLIHDGADEKHLVRQSEAWMRIKQAFFDTLDGDIEDV